MVSPSSWSFRLGGKLCAVLLLTAMVLLIAASHPLIGFQGEDPLVMPLRSVQQSILRGELENARKKLVKILAEFPEDPRPWNMMGVVLAQTGEAERAANSLQRAIELDPTYTGAYLNLGRVYQENLSILDEARSKGIETYRRLLLHDPDNVEGHFQLSLLLHLGGAFRESLAQLGELPADDRRLPQAKVVECANRAALGQDRQAESMTEEVILDERLVEADVLPILPTLRQAGRDDLAIRLLETLFRRGRLSVESSEKLGMLYAAYGEDRKAIRLLESLAGAHPDLPDLLTKMGWVAFEAGEYKESLSYLSHARDLTPEEAQIHLLFGLACTELGLGLEAVNSLEKATSLEPDNPYYRFVLGVAVSHWKEPAEAVPLFEKYLEARPSDVRGETALGRALFLNKEYERARVHFERAVNHPDWGPVAHFYLGAIAKLDLRFEEALAHLNAALEERPDYPDALAEKAAVMIRRRSLEEARTLLERALELDRDHYLANFNFLRLLAMTKGDEYEEQKVFFDQLKEKRWEKASEALRMIKVVPPSESSQPWLRDTSEREGN